ncbi:helix-turn-helix domain-containing protein [Streptomyces sp. NPDC057616]|uniref:helix-turn-helix domain-containing protein n=1 Tax=Streptomyces sp. NPDC057616 TaxID=3346183 RepID=UPI0036A25A42
MSEDTAEAGFARLLRELKDRSGLSYGTLSKRLHMSTSTLHRYCNGDAVPTDYAPVERLARLCKASPDELVDLHRRWVLADANRGRRSALADAPRAEVPGESAAEAPDTPPADPAVPADDPAPRKFRRPGRRVLFAGIAVVAVVGAVALTANLPSGGGDASRDSPVGAASADDGAQHNSPRGSGKPSHSSPSASASPSGREKGDAKGTAGAGQGSASPSAAGGDAPAGVPVTVTTQPYSWEDPCSQHYLIKKPPAQVAPPPVAEDATAWVAAAGAVSAGEQYVTLTVQGSGKETVVLNSLSVRTTARSAPLAWNDYAMGVGCGGGVQTRSFGVDLDAARPAAVPKSGQRNFPFKVSESDPEVFYVKADASAYDTRWYLELNWSSGTRHGTLRIDNHGQPFHTSASTGRPAYEFILGGNAWTKAAPS